MNLKALAHVMIRVQEFDRSLVFYCDVLGLREAFRLTDDDGTIRIIYLHVGGRQFVELSRASGASEGTPAAGYAHICFEVQEIHALYERLKPTGVVVSDIRKGRDGSWLFFLVDPDGNRIEMMQYNDDSRQARFLAGLAGES